MQKAPSNGILHQLHQNYILLKFQNLISKTWNLLSKTWNFLLRKMKLSFKNMNFSIKNMKFSINEVCQNSSFILFVTEFSYHMYGKNAVLNGKQKQMKPLLGPAHHKGFSINDVRRFLTNFDPQSPLMFDFYLLMSNFLGSFQTPHPPLKPDIIMDAP